jgi:hypothetical protein
MASRAAATLRKSQYGHFFKHQGKCRYTPSGLPERGLGLAVLSGKGSG